MEKTVAVFLGILGLVNSAAINGNENKYDVIVVGLGAAGTTAASALARAGKRVLAVEAQGRIGGRVHTIPFGDGVLELGAEWIHGTEGSRVYEMAVNASIPLIYGEVTHRIYNSDGTLANAEIISDLVEYAFEIDLLNSPDEPMPVGEFITGKIKLYIKQNYPELAEDKLFEEKILKLLNNYVSSNEASNDWNDVTTGSQSKQLNGNQQVSFGKYGYKTFFELLLNKYNNGSGLQNLDIKLNTEVTNINYTDNTQVQVTCKGGVYFADYVIVTVSLGVLKDRYKTLFAPALPEEKVTAIENFSMGAVNKVILQFSEPWWPKNILVFSFLWTNEYEKTIPESDRSWLTQMYYASSPEGTKDSLTFWFNGEAAKKIENIAKDELQTKIMQVVRTFMGRNQTIPDPIKLIRSSWFSNPYTRGAYTYDNAWVATHAWGRAALARPLPRVLFAGEATDEQHFSTVHGASDTGYREAMRILNQQ